jgi:hypothetical protein
MDLALREAESLLTWENVALAQWETEGPVWTVRSPGLAWGKIRALGRTETQTPLAWAEN